MSEETKGTQITVHRALSLAKTTKKRIEEILTSNDTHYFIAYRIGKSNTTNKNIPLDKARKDMQGSFDKIEKLISNYWRIKQAIMKNNAGITEETKNIKTVTVNGEEMSVADVIMLQKTFIQYKKLFLQMLTKNYFNTLNEVEKYNVKIEVQLNKQLEIMAGGDKETMTSDSMKAFTMTYRENNQAFIEDPLKLKEKIDALEKEIARIEVEADSALSEQNALSVVTINLDNFD